MVPLRLPEAKVKGSDVTILILTAVTPSLSTPSAKAAGFLGMAFQEA